MFVIAKFLDSKSTLIKPGQVEKRNKLCLILIWIQGNLSMAIEHKQTGTLFLPLWNTWYFFLRDSMVF